MHSSTYLRPLLMLSCVTLAAHAHEPSKLKSGLWEMSITIAGSNLPRA